MKRILLALATLVFLAVGCTSCSSGPEEIASAVAELRGLTPTSEVEFEFVSPDEFRRKLVAAFEKEYSREQAQIEQEVYVMLGLMEEHQDLYDLLLDLYCEQAIGFYDDESDKLYVVSDVEDWGPLQEITFAHEYTHALQDQHFDLARLRCEVEDNSDMPLALQSLIEGDASLTMSRYALAEFDESELQALAKEASAYETERLLAAPRFIREQLLFPYTAGLEFLDPYWEWLNQLYNAPPKSTEQILHREKYLHDEPQEVAIPDLGDVLGEGWRLTHSDVLGEFNLRLYIGQMGPTTGIARVTEGWDGDRLEYWKNDNGNRLLAMYSTWDSASDAGDFYINNGILFDRKYGYESRHTSEDYSALWKSGGLSIYLQLQDQNVLLLISDDEAALSKALYAFPRDTF